jgi:hypothetical protein
MVQKMAEVMPKIRSQVELVVARKEGGPVVWRSFFFVVAFVLQLMLVCAVVS